MARKPNELEVLEVFLAVLMDDLPVEVVVEILEDVCGATLVGLGAVVGELDLFFVDVDRDVSAVEELEAAGVVQMKVRLKDSVDVVDAVARLF